MPFAPVRTGDAKIDRIQDEIARNLNPALRRVAELGAKPTITGSRGGNAALASLITALAHLGLVVDETT